MPGHAPPRLHAVQVVPCRCVPGMQPRRARAPQVMVRKDAIDGSALFLYRKAGREQPVQPLFLAAPPAEASESVRARALHFPCSCRECMLLPPLRAPDDSCLPAPAAALSAE